MFVSSTGVDVEKLKSENEFFRKSFSGLLNDTLARYSLKELGIDPVKLTIYEEKGGVIHKTEIIEGAPPLGEEALITSKAG